MNPLRVGVEVGADDAQRQIGLGRREDQHEQRALQLDVAVQQPQPDLHRDECDGHAGQELEHQRRQEGEPQRRHGRPAIAVGHCANRLDLRLRAAEHLDVASPPTTSRKWPDSRCNVRSWRSGRLRTRLPISTMKTGINGTVTASITAEIQSVATTAT